MTSRGVIDIYSDLFGELYDVCALIIYAGFDTGFDETCLRYRIASARYADGCHIIHSSATTNVSKGNSQP